MPRSPSRFSQADIARAIRAIEQTGAKMEIRIETDGTIRIIPVEQGQRSDRTVPYMGVIEL